jgi:hypothetical protein
MIILHPHRGYYYYHYYYLFLFFSSDTTSAASPTANSIQSEHDEDDFFRELAPFFMYHYHLLSGRGNGGDLDIDSTNFAHLEESAVLSLDRFIELCDIDNETAASMRMRGAAANMFNIHSLSAAAQQNEDDIQTHINTRLSIVRGIDTHARTQFDVPLFMLPTGSNSVPSSKKPAPLGKKQEIHISHSAKPDCFATQFRACLEVKSPSKVRTSSK